MSHLILKHLPSFVCVCVCVCVCLSFQVLGYSEIFLLLVLNNVIAFIVCTNHQVFNQGKKYGCLPSFCTRFSKGLGFGTRVYRISWICDTRFGLAKCQRQSIS